MTLKRRMEIDLNAEEEARTILDWHMSGRREMMGDVEIYGINCPENIILDERELFYEMVIQHLETRGYKTMRHFDYVSILRQ